MNDMGVQPVAEPASGLSQWQRVANTFTAPSKTFEDIKRGNRSWWMPFLITVIFGAFLFGAVTTQVTWQGVFENNQRNMPEFAKRMMANMTPEQKAKQEQQGPRSQAITWALAPLGILVMDIIAAGTLLGTINFGFGGKATFGSIFAVTLYAGLAQWPIKLCLGGVALFAGALPDAFMPQNPAGTNLGYYMNMQDTSPVLYALASNVDITTIWCLVLTSIGVAVVAGTKRSAGYIAVFGWWGLVLLISLGFAAAMG
ncbi:MAG TPA: Yip1 family protein [Terracidiphilus sp.]|nr:Yip1 family protein [Terracidiphilus sp.]